jgi:hypothetical protein
VKIGKTSKDSFAERVVSTFLPEEFLSVFEYKVQNVDQVEKSLHGSLKDFRYESKNSDRKPEFFYDVPGLIEKARAHLKPFILEDVIEASVFEPESNGDTPTAKREKVKTFKEAGIKVGEKVMYTGKGDRKGEEFEVADDKTSILMDDNVIRMSRAAALLEKGSVFAITGSKNFAYKGRTIDEIVNENRQKTL